MTTPITLTPTPARKPRDEELDVFGLSHVGQVRKQNQDHFLLASIQKRLHVLQTNLSEQQRLPLADRRLAFIAMVADGVGGGLGALGAADVEVHPGYARGPAVVVALEQQHPEVKLLKRTFRERAETMVAALHGSTSVSVHMPEGGMFVMADIRPTGLSGEACAWRLLDEFGVAVMPGESFGSRGAGHIRLALTVESDVMAEACHRIRTLADQLVGEKVASS